ncbi:MAG: hypothetical protein J3R72DRAFT_424663 [Linnemannia gamsii]|nr:MAG: hypothetical protein J3R72DRAFT_424663 [Linnemannia gamsii]
MTSTPGTSELHFYRVLWMTIGRHSLLTLRKNFLELWRGCCNSYRVCLLTITFYFTHANSWFSSHFPHHLLSSSKLKGSQVPSPSSDHNKSLTTFDGAVEYFGQAKVLHNVVLDTLQEGDVIPP